MADKNVITALGVRVRQLKDDHKRLSLLCAEYQARIEALKAENRQLQQHEKALESELSRWQLAAGLAGGKGCDRDRARARINRLMREVDKCIDLLSRTDRTQEE